MTTLVDAAGRRAFEPHLTWEPEWTSVCTDRCNLLVEGASPITERLLTLLGPHLLMPVLRMGAREPFYLPTAACGALILTDVSRLSEAGQAMLLAWLDARQERTQVISTTARHLFPLVHGGRFAAALYYRLNTVRLTLDSRGGAL
jgi:hypothetical protein